MFKGLAWVCLNSTMHFVPLMLHIVVYMYWYKLITIIIAPEAHHLGAVLLEQTYGIFSRQRLNWYLFGSNDACLSIHL